MAEQKEHPNTQPARTGKRSERIARREELAKQSEVGRLPAESQRYGRHSSIEEARYRRPDTEILSDVVERLQEEPALEAAELEVAVEEGKVLLSGRAETREAQQAAARIGAAVPGVESLENRIEIRSSRTSSAQHSTGQGVAATESQNLVDPT